MVETQFSLETADAIINDSNLTTGGAYTSVGTYPTQEIVDLVSNLSLRSGTPVPDLLRHFGRHLFHRFAAVHPEFITNHASVFALLSKLDDQIHIDVQKLYNDAELPSFEHEQLSMNSMLFIYHSRRAMPDLAHGLIEGCIAYFGQTMQIERVDLPSDKDGAHTRFTLTVEG